MIEQKITSIKSFKDKKCAAMMMVFSFEMWSKHLQTTCIINQHPSTTLNAKNHYRIIIWNTICDCTTKYHYALDDQS